MRLLFTSFATSAPRKLVAGVSICSIVLAVCLSGCASKPPVAQNSDTSADSSTDAKPMAGVQTIKEKRFLGIFSPYRIDIQQGNFVSSEIMTQLREGMKRPEGMTREQVRFLLGTPLITDIFHADRWDYVFRLRRGNGEVLTSHVTVFFNGTKLANVDGTTLPTEKDYISLIAGNGSTPSK
jgi:outer membrane protein assembly factor BamE